MLFLVYFSGAWSWAVQVGGGTSTGAGARLGMGNAPHCAGVGSCPQEALIPTLTLPAAALHCPSELLPAWRGTWFSRGLTGAWAASTFEWAWGVGRGQSRAQSRGTACLPACVMETPEHRGGLQPCSPPVPITSVRDGRSQNREVQGFRVTPAPLQPHALPHTPSPCALQPPPSPAPRRRWVAAESRTVGPRGREGLRSPAAVGDGEGAGAPPTAANFSVSAPSVSGQCRAPAP